MVSTPEGGGKNEETQADSGPKRKVVPSNFQLYPFSEPNMLVLGSASKNAMTGKNGCHT